MEKDESPHETDSARSTASSQEALRVTLSVPRWTLIVTAICLPIAVLGIVLLRAIESPRSERTSQSAQTTSDPTSPPKTLDSFLGVLLSSRFDESHCEGAGLGYDSGGASPFKVRSCVVSQNAAHRIIADYLVDPRFSRLPGINSDLNGRLLSVTAQLKKPTYENEAALQGYLSAVGEKYCPLTPSNDDPTHLLCRGRLTSCDGETCFEMFLGYNPEHSRFTGGFNGFADYTFHEITLMNFTLATALMKATDDAAKAAAASAVQ